MVLPAVGVTVNLTAAPFAAVVGVTVMSAVPDGAWVVVVTTVAVGVDPLTEFVTGRRRPASAWRRPRSARPSPRSARTRPRASWVPSAFPENWLLPIESARAVDGPEAVVAVPGGRVAADRAPVRVEEDDARLGVAGHRVGRDPVPGRVVQEDPVVVVVRGRVAGHGVVAGEVEVEPVAVTRRDVVRDRVPGRVVDDPAAGPAGAGEPEAHVGVVLHGVAGDACCRRSPARAGSPAGSR